MTYFYAQIDDANKVFTVCQLTGPLVADYAIPIDFMDTSLLGKTYNPGDGTFSE